MRYLRLFAILCLIIGLASSEPLEEHEYSIGHVRTVLKLPAGARISIYQKWLHRMGDRIAIALIKIYDREELPKPDLVRHYLPRIQEAFAAPDWIERETDREPKVTLLLLDFIRRETADLELRSEIDLVSRELQRESGR